MRLRIAQAEGRPDRKSAVQFGESVVRQLDVGGRDVLLEIFPPLHARKDDNVRMLRENEGQRDLRRRQSFAGGDGLKLGHELEVVLEMRLLEAGGAGPLVVGAELGKALELAGEQAAAERRVGDEADAERAHAAEDLPLRLAKEQRIFRLQRRDGMNRVRPPKACRRRLRKPEIADLPLPDELGHGADRVLDRCVRVDAMQIIEVDGFDPEAPQTRLAGGLGIVGPAVDAEKPPVGTANVAELAREDHAIAAPSDGAANQFFVASEPVDVGGVDQVDAKLDGAMDGGDGLALIASTVEFAHGHAAKADGRYLEPGQAELPLLHLPNPPAQTPRVPVRQTYDRRFLFPLTDLARRKSTSAFRLPQVWCRNFQRIFAKGGIPSPGFAPVAGGAGREAGGRRSMRAEAGVGQRSRAAEAARPR